HAAGAVELGAAPSPFAMERLGEISGRLFRLESEAAQLGRRIGAFDDDVSTPKQKARAAAMAPRSSAATPVLVAPEISNGASGGPWLPPRVDATDPGAFDQKMANV
ncbi:MAG: hypothetical protein M3Y55_15625, partial [Pseudomonadota bacterium]|nr:hypothetical protein [Pseudomonadota bacterium]